MPYKTISEKVTLEKDIKSYEPDAHVRLKLEITGISRRTENKIREEFLRLWRKVKESVEEEISCGAG